MSGRGLLTLCALILLGSGVPSAGAETHSILENVPPRTGKTKPTRDALGAVHPDLEIVAEAAFSRIAASADGGRNGRSIVTGTATQLRSLLERGLVTDLRRLREMWEAGIVSEGVIGSDIEDWQRAGWFGQGITIGVIDSSFTGYAELLGTELPEAVVTRSFDADGLEQGDNRHGTAVAELIFDVAPQADLVLVNAGPGRFDEAVDYLMAQGVDVINLSAGWPVGPFRSGGGPDIEQGKVTCPRLAQFVIHRAPLRGQGPDVGVGVHGLTNRFFQCHRLCPRDRGHGDGGPKRQCPGPCQESTVATHRNPSLSKNS